MILPCIYTRTQYIVPITVADSSLFITEMNCLHLIATKCVHWITMTAVSHPILYAHVIQIYEISYNILLETE